MDIICEIHEEIVKEVSDYPLMGADERLMELIFRAFFVRISFVSIH